MLEKPAGEREESPDYRRYRAEPDRLGILGREAADRRLPPKTVVLAVQTADGSAVYPVEELPPGRVVEDRIGEVPVVVVPTGDGGWSAFDRRLLGQVLHLELTPNRRLDDRARDLGPWDPVTGRPSAEKGREGGQALAPLRAMTVYWFAWASFHPGARIWRGR